MCFQKPSHATKSKRQPIVGWAGLKKDRRGAERDGCRVPAEPQSIVLNQVFTGSLRLCALFRVVAVTSSVRYAKRGLNSFFVGLLLLETHNTLSTTHSFIILCIRTSGEYEQLPPRAENSISCNIALDVLMLEAKQRHGPMHGLDCMVSQGTQHRPGMVMMERACMHRRKSTRLLLLAPLWGMQTLTPACRPLRGVTIDISSQLNTASSTEPKLFYLHSRRPYGHWLDQDSTADGNLLQSFSSACRDLAAGVRGGMNVPRVFFSHHCGRRGIFAVERAPAARSRHLRFAPPRQLNSSSPRGFSCRVAFAACARRGPNKPHPEREPPEPPRPGEPSCGRSSAQPKASSIRPLNQHVDRPPPIRATSDARRGRPQPYPADLSASRLGLDPARVHWQARHPILWIALLSGRAKAGTVLIVASIYHFDRWGEAICAAYAQMYYHDVLRCPKNS